MKSVYNELINHFKNMTDDEIKKEFNELKQWNEIGSDVSSYIEIVKNKLLTYYFLCLIKKIQHKRI